MPSPAESTPKQKAAAASRAQAAHLLACSRSLCSPEVIILHTTEGVLRLTASRELWQSLVGLLCGEPSPTDPSAPASRRVGRPRVGVGARLTPERRSAIEAQICLINAGQTTHADAAAALGMSRSAFTGWCYRLPIPAAGKS